MDLQGMLPRLDNINLLRFLADYGEDFLLDKKTDRIENN